MHSLPRHYAFNCTLLPSSPFSSSGQWQTGFRALIAPQRSLLLFSHHPLITTAPLHFVLSLSFPPFACSYLTLFLSCPLEFLSSIPPLKLISFLFSSLSAFTVRTSCPALFLPNLWHWHKSSHGKNIEMLSDFHVLHKHNKIKTKTSQGGLCKLLLSHSCAGSKLLTSASNCSVMRSKWQGQSYF